MKKSLIVLFVIFITLSFVLNAVESNRDVLKKEAKTEEVSAELQEPDGVSIKFLPDGHYRIWARGTGIYDFNDDDDKQDALQEAILKAKANLSKFMMEKLTTEQSYDRISKKMKKASKNGGTVSKSVSKEDIKTIAQSIKTNSNAILKGVLVLETLKTPNKSGEGGKIEVVLGVSYKSVILANRLKKDINSNNYYKKESKSKKYSTKKDKKERKKSETEW